MAHYFNFSTYVILMRFQSCIWKQLDETLDIKNTGICGVVVKVLAGKTKFPNWNPGQGILYFFSGFALLKCQLLFGRKILTESHFLLCSYAKF